MKTNQEKSKIGLLLAVFVLITPSAIAQQNFKQTGPSKITIAGTSTMHDWTMGSHEATFTSAFEVNEQGSPVVLRSLLVTIPAESLKSGKGAMDKNAYAALKTESNKIISFQLVSSKMDGRVIRCSGKLTIAGVGRVVDLEAVYTLNTNNSIQIEGTKEIDMRAFGVEPPSFMFGSVKTGEKITLSFDVTLMPENIQSITLN